MIEPITQQRLAALAPPAQPPPQAVDPGLPRTLARIPVLVIEDEAMIAWMLESLLEDMGFMLIALASNAAEAAAAAAKRLPELVISDINLGDGADGIDAVISIREKCCTAVVFVSAYVDDDARFRISEHVLGARTLAKPLNVAALSDAVQRVLGLDRAI